MGVDCVMASLSSLTPVAAPIPYSPRGEEDVMFGRPLPEYVRFEKGILVAILAVGVVRLVLSLAGVPNGTVKLFSVNAVQFVGAIWVSVTAAASGFGTYRHLLPLIFIQSALAQAIVIFGIGLSALTGRVNIYAAPEYSNLPNYLPHALGHVAAVFIVTLVLWLVGSLVMWITRAVRGGGAPAGAKP